MSDFELIEQRIKADGYAPKTSMENLISMALVSFDCPDNYGEWNPETCCDGYGDEFTLDGLFQYIEDCGGWSEFDWEV